MAEIFGFDCYSPREIAERVENVGVTKANLPRLSQIALGILAGGFIGLGAMFFTLVVSDGNASFSAARVMGGVAFSLGLVLVLIAGAELFTGNNLLIMAWVSRRISTVKLVENLVLIYCSNLIGAAGLAFLVALSGEGKMAGGTLAKTAVSIAAAKCALPFGEAFFRGVLCNVLVCLAVWLAMAGRNVADKILAIVFPVTAFVACGYEHSVANMYFIPLGLWWQTPGGANEAAIFGWVDFVKNLLPVTLGNLVGGAGMVGLVYWVIYRRGQPPPAPVSVL